MTAPGPCPKTEAEAQRYVGKFLQHFAETEQALNSGIGKLLGLAGGKVDIVCSSIPFAKKVNVFFSAEGLVASLPDSERRKRLKEIRSKIMSLNETRVIFAHCPFSSTEKGVTFRRAVVREVKLSVTDIRKSWNEIEQLCYQADKLVRDLQELVSGMKPYKPSLDFSDPRNSGYLAGF
ncbi:MAG: hypothetical protein R3E04_06640 [Sphingobium sp.]